MKPFNYENEQYLRRLNELPDAFYLKYFHRIQICLADQKDKFLDVGCGNGRVLAMLARKGYRAIYGIDISDVFVEASRKQGFGHIKRYDGVSIPFENNYFDTVGSFNVLEHVGNPQRFLQEQIRVLRPGGHLIVACPNFLTAVLHSPHPHIAGPVQKIRNVCTVVRKLMMHDYAFGKMPLILRTHFEYDDDAIVVTNLPDIREAITVGGCSIIYESGFIQGDCLIHRIVDGVPILKYFLPSCFVVARKN
jgi:SAM-dependent methyltransferase